MHAAQIGLDDLGRDTWRGGINERARSNRPNDICRTKRPELVHHGLDDIDVLKDRDRVASDRSNDDAAVPPHGKITGCFKAPRQIAHTAVECPKWGKAFGNRLVGDALAAGGPFSNGFSLGADHGRCRALPPGRRGTALLALLKSALAARSAIARAGGCSDVICDILVAGFNRPSACLVAPLSSRPERAPVNGNGDPLCFKDRRQITKSRCITAQVKRYMPVALNHWNASLQRLLKEKAAGYANAGNRRPFRPHLGKQAFGFLECSRGLWRAVLYSLRCLATTSKALGRNRTGNKLHKGSANQPRVTRHQRSSGQRAIRFVAVDAVRSRVVK